jgi:glycosyltransferase involved in cell wall biosynthesis
MARFSLVVATIERATELDKLLASLASQTFSDFEVILVDQNQDDRVKVIAKPWTEIITIRHLRSEKGLSRARNRGLAEAKGEIIAFPDDDCWYGINTLQQVNDWFLSHKEFDFLSTCAMNETHKLTANRWLNRSSEISRRNVFRSCISISLFFRQSAIRAVDGFDEFIGVGSGSKFGSGEDTDYVLRILQLGHRGWFEASFAIFHPDPKPDVSPAAQSRARSYGLGFGYVQRMHKMPFLIFVYLCMRPAAGWLLNFARGRKSSGVYLATLRGRLAGYFHPAGISR